MAVIKIEGKDVTLPDAVVEAGEQAVRAVLTSNGFPGADVAEIVLPTREERRAGAPAVVTSRGTGKGATFGPEHALVLEHLMSAPVYLNPAIELAAAAARAEAEGDDGFIERALRDGSLERAVAEGEREGVNVEKTLRRLGHTVPATSKTVPVGF